MKLKRRTWVLWVVVTFAACHSKSPTEPGESLTGSWRGPIADTTLGDATLAMKIVQTGFTVAGTWSVPFTGAGRAGTVTGSVLSSGLSLNFTADAPLHCADGSNLREVMGTFLARTSDGFSGQYVVPLCPGTGIRGGTIDIGRTP